jgi:hypothetical protein
VDWLPSAELALNNHVNASTGMTPFFANHGRHPRMGFWDAELARKGNEGLPTPQKRLMDEADTFAKQMNEVLTQLHDNVAIAQAKQQYHADQHRAPAPDYPIGSTVWLDARNIRTQRPAKKLDSKHLGPFKVVAAIGRRSYQLELPASMRIHPVFHTSLLTRAADNPLLGQRNPPPPPVIVEREGADTAEREWEVEEVVGSLKKRNKLFYKVKWTGIDEVSEQPWYDLLPGSEVAVANFHKKYPNMPGPLAQFKSQLASLMMGREDSALAYEPLSMVEPSHYDTPPLTQLTTVDIEDDDDVVINEWDDWMIDVTGAPYWEEGSNVIK